jgi:hypothetical protein
VTSHWLRKKQAKAVFTCGKEGGADMLEIGKERRVGYQVAEDSGPDMWTGCWPRRARRKGRGRDDGENAGRTGVSQREVLAGKRKKGGASGSNA